MTEIHSVQRAVRRVLAIGAIAAFGASALAVSAKPAPAPQPAGPAALAPPAAAPSPLQTIVVTGSLISTTSVETPNPVQILTKAQIVQSGYTNMSDILRNISANGANTLSQSFSFAFAAGGSGISLRGLTLGDTLVLIDGGLGQLHAAASALEQLGLVTQPLASIAKREEILYVYGQEDEPIVLERRSPVLHLIQRIRDESHRFAVAYHRKRRQMRDRASELDQIPGVGAITRQRLLEHFGSVQALQQTVQRDPDSLTAVVNKPTAEKIRRFFSQQETDSPSGLVNITTG